MRISFLFKFSLTCSVVSCFFPLLCSIRKASLNLMSSFVFVCYVLAREGILVNQLVIRLKCSDFRAQYGIAPARRAAQKAYHLVWSNA